MNLVGISGKKNTGKDTVAKMLMFLQDYKISGYSFPITISNYQDWLINGHLEKSRIERKQFADKLKDSVCNWIGCTRKQLEDREFKEAPLGEEWKIYEFYHLKHSKGNSFKQRVIRASEEECKRYMDLFNIQAKINSQILTPRKLMQLLGTECGRQIIHPNIWINALFADYIPKEVRGSEYWEYQSKWIVTDVRFENEAKAIKDRGGKLIRINRYIDPIEDGIDDHHSETALDNYDSWDMVIWNREGLAELLTEVQKFHDKNNWA
jgi:hypothetical protein